MIHTMSMHLTLENCLNANKNELKRILDDMDIPDGRKDMTQQSLSWLQRNMAIRNSQHPEFDDALKIVLIILSGG